MSKSRIWCIEQGISCVSRMEIQYLERSETFQMFTSAVVGRRTTGVPSQRVLNERSSSKSLRSRLRRERDSSCFTSRVLGQIYTIMHIYFSQGVHNQE